MVRGGHVAQLPWRCPAVLAVALASSACVSATQVVVNAPGASVFVDDRLVGSAPVTIAEPAVAGARLRLRVAAPGYRDFIGELSADRWNVGRVVAASVAGALTGGVGLLGLAFAAEWAPRYQVLLEPVSPAARAAAEAGRIAVRPAIDPPLPVPDYRPPKSPESRP